MTQIITFYSFKGGVGRTMALVNTGHALAKQGARVLMVDFDLEAPGMTHFFGKAVRRRRKGAARDALDLLLEAKRTYQEVARGGNPLAPPLALDDYTVHLKLPPSVSNPESPYLEGRVDLLPATLEPRSEPAGDHGKLSTDYLDRIAALDLPGIFGPDGPGHLFGKHVGDYFRLARFRAPGDLVFALRDPVQGAYDFVLVDSRTGLNEISGLCVGPLCDSLVVCTGLNEQNVAGTRYFLERTGLLDKQKAKPHLVVVGPVPPWRSEESAARIADIRRSLSAQEVFEVPYHPSAALVERVYVFDEPAEAIAEPFTALAKRMTWFHVEAFHLFNREVLTPFDRGGLESSEIFEAWQSVAAKIPTSVRLMVCAKTSVAEAVRPPFPTLLESTVLSGRLAWQEAEQHAMAVAVAIHRRLSAAVTERVVRLLDRVVVRHERDRLLVYIAFFFSRLHGKVGRKVLSEHLNEQDKRQLETVMSGEDVAGLAGLALRQVSGGRWNDEEIKDAAYKLERYQPGFWVLWEGLPKLKYGDLWRAHYLDARLGVDPPPHSLTKFAKHLAKLPERGHSVRELLRQDSFQYGEPGPPGFSVVLASASMIAALEGVNAVKSVLSCIEVGRLIHGYGWRVLINWKRLRLVRRCAAFKEFMAEEDAAIEKVEKQFDRGVWPL